MDGLGAGCGGGPSASGRRRFAGLALLLGLLRLAAVLSPGDTLAFVHRSASYGARRVRSNSEQMADGRFGQRELIDEGLSVADLANFRVCFVRHAGAVRLPTAVFIEAAGAVVGL